MPTNQSVTLVKGTIPPGLCFSNIPELYNTFVDTTTAYVNGNYSLFNFGNSTPSADDNDKPWVRTDGDGRPDKMYVYKDGYWLCKHPTPASGKERRIWTGTDTELLSYEADGNSSSTATIYSGPFWEVDSTLSGSTSNPKSYEALIFDSDTIDQIQSGTNPKDNFVQAHGLGELPDQVSVTFLCVQDDSTTGYSVGDEVATDSVFAYWNSGGSSLYDPVSTSVTFDETNVYASLWYGNQEASSRLTMMPKDAAPAHLLMPTSKFKFRVRVWRKGGNTVSDSSPASFSYIKRTARVYYTA